MSHGQVIQGVLATLKSGSVDDFHRYAQPNASYAVFELINGSCTVLSWGIATHLRHWISRYLAVIQIDDD